MRRLLPAVLAIVAIVVSGALVSHAGTTFSGGGGGDTLNAAATQVKWNASLGAIDHVEGPSDQPLVVTAGAAQNLNMGTPAGQTINLNGGSVTVQETVTSYNEQTTAGVGISPIVLYVALLADSSPTDTHIGTYTAGAADEVLEIGGFMIATVTSGSVGLRAVYTDAAGNARTQNMSGNSNGGVDVTTLGVTGFVAYKTTTIALNASAAMTFRMNKSGTNTNDFYVWVRRIN